MSRIFKTANGTELPIISLRGKEYLEVKYRLVWFREDHPNWSIETEALEHGEKSSFFKAVIRDDSGKIRATAHKTETAAGFEDHAEKAETGAVGRALALCGFGTQFAPEIEEGDRVVDAPTDPKKPSKPAELSANVISEAQRKRLFAITKGRGMEDGDREALLKKFGYESSKDIKKSDYEKIVKSAEEFKAFAPAR